MSQNRRTFLKNATVASAALAVMPSCISNSSSNLPEIGLQLYTIRDEMAKDPARTLERVRNIGYKKIETAGYSEGKMYGYTGKAFKELLDNTGLKNISGHFSLDVFEKSFDQALEFMAEAQQEYVVLPHLQENQRRALDQYRKHAELLNRCGEKARTANIRVGYHNHDFEFQLLDGKLPMDVLLNETDPGLVDIELDLYWISKVGLDPVAFFKSNKNRVPLWHVKDMDAETKHFAEVGTGIIDFSRIFDHKDISGMKHFFVEQDVSPHPMKSIEISFNNLTNHILAK